MKTEYSVGKVLIKPNLILAPMAGVTDSSFRKLIKRRGGVGLIVTEFISVEGLTRNNLRTHRMMYFEEEERPISIQFFGHNEDRMAAAAEIAEAAGADIVDVNCGCPARKVVSSGGGASLLRDLPKMERILRAMRKVIKIPLTLKYRMGWDEKSINAIEVAKLAEACGVEQLVLHGRTRVQGYSGQADWDIVARVKQAVKIPVVGSGDVRTPEQAIQRMKETEVDGVMIGRGAMANPWIFRQTWEMMQGLTPYQPTIEDKRLFLKDYFDVMLQEMPTEKAAIGKVKQLCAQFSHGLPGGAQFRERVFHSQSVSELLGQIDEYFSRQVYEGAA
ncbi:MAG: tRNA dihydrouridine synthase DusB [Acidobacteriota bacterium]|nr:tRNA dihydrouridine synthase DusB [Blastocatellia bacterium]MDW8412890.1 tRNA dihydrouridine synthase DusB [Acidobacteriota bacterium]